MSDPGTLVVKPYSKEVTLKYRQKLNTKMCIKALFITAKFWKQSRGLTMEKQLNYGPATKSIIITVFKMYA